MARSGTTAESNTFIDCQREIAFGLIERTPDDHTGGVIRNNFIYRQPSVAADAAIGVFDSRQRHDRLGWPVAPARRRG